MATNCSNTKVSPALRGQSTYVFLSGAEAISILPYLSIGTQCTINSSTTVCFVDFIDTLGHVFRMKPRTPAGNCASDTPGYLKVNEVITLNI